ncbi:MerR family transcriptional regulator [Nesterenkonia ebinurensis]|uniref:MerR family transcriptional regulator n=1 Tax=Nesterenkonia ebinurensis TaxID=2608252 RepID=UPI00123CD586|nr:MerR family transcriptional regulator [Nesterenkonia ebinurensis]
MRIGELAEIVGVSTRTVRHYHHEGLMPEPARDSSGYRRYTVSDLAQLIRVRRLRDIGCSVDDIRRVTTGEPTLSLRDVLQQLDEDLAGQQRVLDTMRERIQQLLAGPDLEDAVASGGPASRDVFSQLKELGAEGPAYHTDRAMMAAVPETDAQNWAEAWSQIMDDPEAAEALAFCYAEFDALISADPEDPKIPALADRIWEVLPKDYLSTLAPEGENHSEAPIAAALAESMSPAQNQVMDLLTQRLSAMNKRQ